MKDLEKEKQSDDGMTMGLQRSFRKKDLVGEEEEGDRGRLHSFGTW